MYLHIEGEIPPWLRNAYPFKTWLNNNKEPVITRYGVFHLSKGEYRILPNGKIIGRCRVCGKPIISSIKEPKICWIHDCIHCPESLKCKGKTRRTNDY